jgi:hypothetical protein
LYRLIWFENLVSGILFVVSSKIRLDLVTVHQGPVGQFAPNSIVGVSWNGVVGGYQQHVIVATADGKVTEIYWKPGEVHQGLLDPP